MATLKCLACGQDNRVGEESCTRCFSSLNLRLCSGCEAINDHTADRCHSCGEAFADDVSAPTPAEEPAAATQPPQAEPTRVEATKVEATLEFAMVEDPSAPRSLPARRLIEPPPRRGARFVQVAVLWAGAIVLGVGAAYAYHQYQVSGWPALSGLILPKMAPAPKPVESPSAANTAPSSPVAQAPAPAAEPKAASAPVAPKIAQSSAAQATARVEPKQSMAPVTHTRAGSAAGETQPPARSSVTAPVAATAAAAAIQPSIEKPMNPNPSTCAPAVAALGLCISK